MFRNQKQFFHPNKKNIFRFLDPNKKNVFRFLDPNKKKYFQIPATQTGHFHNQILLFSVGRLFCQQKVGCGNETKCFGTRNSSFIQTKKKYFLDFSTQQKIYFKIPRSKQKKYF